MHGIAANCIEVRRQGGHEGLSLSRAHLRNLAVVEYHASDELDIKVTHLQRPSGGLPDYRKRLDQKFLRPFTRPGALAEFVRFCLELSV